MNQLLREKIIALIHSGDLRRYFRERQNDIPDIMYFQTIDVAPVSLKLKKRLITQCANDAETDDETREFAEAAVKELAGAFSRLYHPIEGDIFVAEQYAMHEIGGHNIDIRTEHTDVELMKNFEAVKAHMDQLKYWDWSDQLDEFDMYYKEERKAHPEIDWDKRKKEWIKPPYWYWRVKIVNMTADKRKGIPEYEFICSAEGEPQYLGLACRQRSAALSGGRYVYNPPVPYQNGDILRIDCSPYGPGVSYCLVSDAAKSGINCLYPASSGKIGLGSVAECYYYENENTRCSFLPPLFQAELYEGELPENCSFMRTLSGKLKGDPKLGSRLTEKIMENVSFLGGEDWPSMRRWRDEEEWQIEREELFSDLTTDR